ncbi:MAG TPA: hypothetical protein VML96_02550, partial [Egibacteraceae bacterium]|nr:hypothetical protein [Egibacteraceae bacterium]
MLVTIVPEPAGEGQRSRSITSRRASSGWLRGLVGGLTVLPVGAERAVASATMAISQAAIDDLAR